MTSTPPAAPLPGPTVASLLEMLNLQSVPDTPETRVMAANLRILFDFERTVSQRADLRVEGMKDALIERQRYEQEKERHAQQQLGPPPPPPPPLDLDPSKFAEQIATCVSDMLDEGQDPDDILACMDVRKPFDAVGPALLCLLRASRINVVVRLIQRGADIKVKGTNGDGALVQAAMSGHIGMVNFVLMLGAGTEVVSPQAVQRALGRAVLVLENDAIIRRLVGLGADVNQVDDDAQTPLCKAVLANAPANVATLLSLGASDAAPGCLNIIFLAHLHQRNDMLLLLLESMMGKTLRTVDDMARAFWVVLTLRKIPLSEEAVLEIVQIYSISTTNLRHPVEVLAANHAARMHLWRSSVCISPAKFQGLIDMLNESPPALPSATRAKQQKKQQQKEEGKRKNGPAACFLWTKYGACKYGDACLFVHPATSQQAPSHTAIPFEPNSVTTRPPAEELDRLRPALEAHTAPGVYEDVG